MPTLTFAPAAPAAFPQAFHDPALHRGIGEVAGERVVIIGRDTLDLMCAVIREGALEVTLLRLHERPPAHEADVAILVGLTSSSEISGAVQQARRALAPTGRVIVGLASAWLGEGVAAILRAQGFSDVCTKGSLVCAEVPFFGPLGRLRSAEHA